MNLTNTAAANATVTTTIEGGNTMIYQNTNNLMVGVSSQEEHVSIMKDIYANTLKTVGQFRDSMQETIGTSFLTNRVNQLALVKEGAISLGNVFMKDLKTRPASLEQMLAYEIKTAEAKVIADNAFSPIQRCEKRLGEELKEMTKDGYKLSVETVERFNGDLENKSKLTIKERFILSKDGSKTEVHDLLYPAFEFVTGLELIELFKKENAELGARVERKFGKIFAENAWANYAIKDGNVYSANFYVADSTTKPVSKNEFKTVSTKEYFETVINSLRNLVVELKTTIDAKEYFFADSVVTRITENSDKFNVTLFNYAGTLEDFVNNDRKIYTELLSGFFVTNNWIKLMMSNREEAEFCYKNEWTPMQAGVGQTAVEFKTFFMSELVTRRVYNWTVSTKSNRFMNSNNGATNAGGFRELLHNDIPALIVFVDKIDKWSHMLNAGFANTTTWGTLAPAYLNKKIQKAIATEKGMTAKVHVCALKRQLSMVDLQVSAQLEEITLLEKFYGTEAPIILIEAEPKAEYGAWIALQQEIKAFLNGSEFVLPALSEIMPRLETTTIPKAEFTIIQDGKTSVKELAYMIAPFSFHYKKDCWNASGKTAIGRTNTTIQGLLTQVTQLSGSVEANIERVRDRKFVDSKEFAKVLASAGQEMFLGEWVKTEKFTWFFDDSKQYDKFIRAFADKYADKRVMNAELADLILSEQDTTKANGFMNKGLDVYKMVASENGSPVLRNKKDNLLTADEVAKIFEPSEVLTLEDMFNLKPIFDKILNQGYELVDASSELFRRLESTRVIQLTQDIFLPFTASSKKITKVIPTELKQAILAYRASSEFSVEEIKNFDRAAFIEEIKSNPATQKRFDRFIKDAKIKTSRVFEINGVLKTLDNAVIEMVNSAKKVLFRPMLELREALLTKKAKDYLTVKENRMWLTVTTHRESTDLAFVNKKTLKTLLAEGIAKEFNGRFYIAVKRYPETMLAQLTLEVQVNDVIANNVICVADVALSVLMGDTDGDMLETIEPFDFNMQTEVHKYMRQNRKAIRKYYEVEYNADLIMSETISKFAKIYKEFGDDSAAAIASLKAGILLNEGTEAMTGMVVAWDTKVTMLLLMSGATNEELRNFKAVLGAYLAQITIASKNNTAQMLLEFKKNWVEFSNGTHNTEAVEGILKAVTCKYL